MFFSGNNSPCSVLPTLSLATGPAPAAQNDDACNTSEHQWHHCLFVCRELTRVLLYNLVFGYKILHCIMTFNSWFLISDDPSWATGPAVTTRVPFFADAFSLNRRSQILEENNINRVKVLQKDQPLILSQAPQTGETKVTPVQTPMFYQCNLKWKS